MTSPDITPHVTAHTTRTPTHTHFFLFGCVLSVSRYRFYFSDGHFYQVIFTDFIFQSANSEYVKNYRLPVLFL